MNRYELLMQELTDFGDLPLRKQKSNPVSELELDAVEERFGYLVPPDYREFLQQYGGFNIYKDFPIPRSQFSTSWRASIIGFFDAKSLCPAESCMIEENLLPSNSIAIGFGDKGYILLVLEEPRKGQVYFWDFSQTRSAIESENLHFVTRTFNDFIESLQVDKGTIYNLDYTRGVANPVETCLGTSSSFLAPHAFPGKRTER